MNEKPDLTADERRQIRVLERLASGSPGDRQQAIERCEAIDVAVELMREHYRDAHSPVTITFDDVPDDVWTEQDGLLAVWDKGTKRDELAPGLIVEWVRRR